MFNNLTRTGNPAATDPGGEIITPEKSLGEKRRQHGPAQRPANFIYLR